MSSENYANQAKYGSGPNQGKLYRQTVEAHTTALFLLKEESKDVNFKDLGQLRAWLWKHRLRYTMVDLTFVSGIPRDRLRNAIYGLGLAYPKKEHGVIETLKKIPNDDIPTEITREWLLYALNKYTKSAVASAIGVRYDHKFLEILRSYDIPPNPKIRHITETELREAYLVMTFSDVCKHFGVHENYIQDLMVRYKIVRLDNRMKRKCVKRDKAVQERESNRINAIERYISGPKSPVRQAVR